MKVRRGPDGLHLFDRDTGLNLLLNKEPITPDLWTESPRQVSISLTNVCNLNCTHCFAPKDTSFISLEKLKTWLAELDQAGCFGVGFGGGEPTLHKDFIELCRYTYNETSLALSFTTHGLSLSESFVQKIKPYVSFTRVSMDGLDKTYESIRGRPFGLFRKKIRLLKGNIPFGINYVVNTKTISTIDEAISFAVDIGAQEFLVLPEQSVGRGNKIDNATLKKLQSRLQNSSNPIRVAISSQYQGIVESLNVLRKEPSYIAYSHIDATGKIKITSFDHSGEQIDIDGVITAYKKLIHRRC